MNKNVHIAVYIRINGIISYFGRSDKHIPNLASVYKRFKEAKMQL